MTLALDLGDLVVLIVAQAAIGAGGALLGVKVLAWRVGVLEQGQRDLWSANRAVNDRIDNVITRRG